MTDEETARIAGHWRVESLRVRFYLGGELYLSPSLFQLPILRAQSRCRQVSRLSVVGYVSK